MIQQSPQLAVEYREAAPSLLDGLLRRDYLPRDLHSPCVICPPEDSLPSRWEVIDHVFEKYGHFPQAGLEVVYGVYFARSLIPTTGRLYVDCTFLDCDLMPGDGHWELIDALIHGGRLWQQVGSASPGAVLKGNLVLPTRPHYCLGT